MFQQDLTFSCDVVFFLTAGEKKLTIHSLKIVELTGCTCMYHKVSKIGIANFNSIYKIGFWATIDMQLL